MVFHRTVFLRTWNVFSRGTEVVSGGLVLPLALYLTLPEVGLRVNSDFSLLVLKNLTSVLTSDSESGDLGIRLWMKLLGIILSPLAILLQSQYAPPPSSRPLGQWALQTGGPISLLWGARVGM